MELYCHAFRVWLSVTRFTNLVHQREGVVLVRLLPGVVREVVEVGQHLRRPVLGPLPWPVVEHVKVVGKEVKAKGLISNAQMHRKCNLFCILMREYEDMISFSNAFLCVKSSCFVKVLGKQVKPESECGPKTNVENMKLDQKQSRPLFTQL